MQTFLPPKKTEFLDIIGGKIKLLKSHGGRSASVHHRTADVQCNRSVCSAFIPFLHSDLRQASIPVLLILFRSHSAALRHLTFKLRISLRCCWSRRFTSRIRFPCSTMTLLFSASVLRSRRTSSSLPHTSSSSSGILETSPVGLSAPLSMPAFFFFLPRTPGGRSAGLEAIFRGETHSVCGGNFSKRGSARPPPPAPHPPPPPGGSH